MIPKFARVRPLYAVASDSITVGNDTKSFDKNKYFNDLLVVKRKLVNSL